MRIERVTADTFSEASDRARQRYGSDALILSTSKVGNITELLVCVDADDDGFVPAPGFRDELTSQIAKVIPKRPEPSTQEQLQAHVQAQAPTPMQPARGAEAAAAVDGSALVTVIRQELQALEKRLSSSAGASTLVRERMALLEQGVSANYSARLLEHMNDFAAMSQQMIDDLKLSEINTRQHCSSDERSCCVVGPAGSGKTTLAIQLAADTGMVQSWRDKRPGSRERFFAMADRAGIDAGWGAIAPAHAVIDTAGLSLGELEESWTESGEETSRSRNIVLALPATISRSEASRWLHSSLPIAGVVITHWDSTRMPLGLLATIAESKQSLWGVSSSSDPSERVQSIDAEAIRQSLSLILQLVLSEPQHATE